MLLRLKLLPDNSTVRKKKLQFVNLGQKKIDEILNRRLTDRVL